MYNEIQILIYKYILLLGGCSEGISSDLTELVEGALFLPGFDAFFCSPEPIIN